MTAAGKRRGHRRAWIALGLLLIAGAGYFATFTFIAYTDDAYIWSDLVTIASEVGGPVQSVAVHDNQKIEVGDLVAAIDPAPYKLDVDLKLSRIAGLEAAVAVKREAGVATAANADAASGALIYAQREFGRIEVLARDQTATQAELDRVRDTLRTAKDRLTDLQAKVLVNRREVDAAKSAIAVAKAELAIAQYRLSRTRLVSTVAGTVNNLSLRPGDYAQVGEGLVGIVDASRWRVVANFKEEVAAGLEPGHPVWMWLDSDPWHVWTGKVQGVGRGIARSPGPGARQLLPYVAPTTDWIRLRRRLPVTILFDPPVATRVLFMGADARVLLFR